MFNRKWRYAVPLGADLVRVENGLIVPTSKLRSLLAGYPRAEWHIRRCAECPTLCTRSEVLAVAAELIGAALPPD